MKLSLVRRRQARLALGILVGLLALASGIAAVGQFDFQRDRRDQDRVAKLATADLPTLAPSAQAEGWPQWRGPFGDGVSHETGLLDEWPESGPPIVWRKPVGRGFSSFAINLGRLITMEEEAATDAGARFESIVCLDAGTGNELWRHRYLNHYDERFGPGPRSTPAIDGEFVYTVGPTGIMHCLRADNGAKVWRRDLLDEFHGRPMQYGVAFSPLVEGGLVFVAPGGPDGSSVAALDKTTGATVWKALDDPASYSSPIIVSAGGVRQVLFLTNLNLVSFAPEDGREHWRFPWKAEGGFNIATPFACGDYVFTASGYGKGCALLEVTGGPNGRPRAARVYEHNRLRPFFASPVRVGDFVYGFDQMDLVCLNVRTGAIVWREKTIRDFRKGSLLAAEGNLIVCGELGTLALVEATPAGYHEKSSCRLSPTRCWTAPALANGLLYVRNDAEIVCFDLRKPGG
jgi:outer membrane protein assembly factor BamB